MLVCDTIVCDVLVRDTISCDVLVRDTIVREVIGYKAIVRNSIDCDVLVRKITTVHNAHPPLPMPRLRTPSPTYPSTPRVPDPIATALRSTVFWTGETGGVVTHAAAAWDAIPSSRPSFRMGGKACGGGRWGMGDGDGRREMGDGR